MNLTGHAQWRRLSAGSYALEGTGYAIERREWDERWHCFLHDFALGFRASTLHEAKAFILDDWARKRENAS